METEEILLKLQEMDLIQLAKKSGDYYMCRCPIHNDGQEKKPSCGVLLHDVVRDGKVTPAGFTHCFRGDTEVITRTGIKPIAELCDKPNVQIINGNGEWETTVFRNYGYAQLWKLTLSRDQQTKVIYTTKDHEWFVDTKVTLRTTENLHPNWYLQSYIHSAQSYNVVLDGIIHGIIYGDGTRTHHYKMYGSGNHRIFDKTQPTRVSYRINIPKFSKKSNLVRFFTNNPTWTIGNITLNNKEYFCINSALLPVTHNYKKLPTLDLGRDYLMSFLSGYFACDGSIDLMKIHSSKIDDLYGLRDICAYCGISTTDIKVIQHDTNFKKNATLGMLYMYPKSIPEEFYLLDKPKVTKYSRSRWKIVSVESTNSYDDVYCCETSTQSFVLSGNILTHNCFSCGWAKSLPDTVTEILKRRKISSLSGMEWLKENIPGFDGDNSEFDYLIPRNLMNPMQHKYAFDYLQSLTKVNKSPTYVSEEELATYRMTVPYMYQRGLTDEIIEKYDIGYDANFIPPGRKKPVPCVTFPVKDIKGNTLFLCRRSIEGKMFHYPQGVEKSVYGLYELPPNPKSVIICESCFNALTAVKYGYNAVALLGTGTSYEIQQLRMSGIPMFVLCLDGDDAGQRGAIKLKRALSDVAIVWTIHMPPDKDLNDCTKEEFDQLYSQRG